MIGGNSMLDQAVASNAATLLRRRSRPGTSAPAPELSQDAILGNLTAAVPADPARR